MSSSTNTCVQAGRDQFDIRNHVDYESHMKQHMKKSECAELVKKAKTSMVPPAPVQIKVRVPVRVPVPVPTPVQVPAASSGELETCRNQLKELARALKKQHDIEQDSRYLELKKKVRALELNAEKKGEVCKQLADYRLEDHPEYANKIAELKKKHQLELEMARTEVELSWKKKMYTDIKSHPQYESLIHEHELRMKMLEQELGGAQCRSTSDITKNPEYRRLMQKYVECKENRHKKQGGSSCSK